VPPATGAVQPPLPLPKGAIAIKAYTSSEPNAAVSTYLLTGETDAMLVDAQLVNSEAANVARMIKESGKKLRMIYVTHSHPDHYMGLELLHREFPDARIVAKKGTIDAMVVTFGKYKPLLDRFFPGDVASALVSPEAIEGSTIMFEKTPIQILDFENGEATYATALHIPSMKALLCADLAYNHVHPLLNELHIDGALGHVKKLHALEPVDVILPGHGGPIKKPALDEYVSYVNTLVKVSARAKSATEIIDAMTMAYPDYKGPAGLRFTAFAMMEARDKGKL